MTKEYICAVTMAASLAAFATPATAAVTVYTDPLAFAAALSNLKTYSFDSVPTGYYGGAGATNGGLSSENVAITTNALLFATSSAFGTGINLTAQQESPTVVNVTLPGRISGFALQYFSGNRVSITVNGETLLAPATPIYPTFGFFGIVADQDFSQLSFSTPGAGIDFDNFTTGSITSAVPEPASWAMMTIGLAIVGSCLRSSRGRRRSSYDQANLQ